VRENVIVAYRGTKFELGQWPYGYGIWSVADQEPLPIEWWDPTPEGWSAAWYRFAAIEVPGTITPVGRQAADPNPAASAPPVSARAAAVLAAGAPDAGSMTAPGPADTAAKAPAAPPGQGSTTPPASVSGVRPAPFFGPPGPQPDHSRQAAPPAGYAPPSAAPPGYPAPQPGYPPAAAMSATQTAAAPGRPAELSPARSRLAAGLLAAGVVLGVIGLFPAYNTASLASQAASLWPHLFYLAGWAVSAVLIFRGGRLQRTGALLATGASVVTLGLFLADVGFPIADGTSLLGAGLVLGLVGWAACAAGSAVAFGRWPADWPRRPLGPDAGVVAAIIVAGLGVAVTFAPAWDRITLPTGSGVSLSETLGNAFSNPGAVIAGDVLVMLGLVAVVAVAALWRPARMGWALIAGALIPMTAQIVSAVIQAGQTTTAAELGVSPTQAAQLGISTGQVAQTSLTAAFWLYCMFVVVLLIACAWLAFGRDELVHARSYRLGGPAGHGGGQPGYGSQPGYGTSAPGAWPTASAGYPAPGGQPAAPAGSQPDQSKPGGSAGN